MSGVRNRKRSGDSGLHCVNRWEAAYLGREVGAYLDHGIRLEPGATVIDAGANIGVFSAHVCRVLDGAVRIFAAEPLPPIFALLERNARERMGGEVTPLPYGFSSKDEELEFTYFPLMTILSSAYRNRDNMDEERRRITAAITQLIKAGHTGPVLRLVPTPLLRMAVRRRLRAMGRMRTHRVRVRSLSDVLDEHGIGTVDLLKIDVEGAELDVLQGIDDRHWPIIRQTVVEVEGWRGNHAQIEELLTARGFRVRPHQGPVHVVADIGMIYACRD